MTLNRSVAASLLVLAVTAVLTVALGSVVAPPAAATPGETVTTELQPGLNLAGWTERETRVDKIFRAIPRLQMVYAWDTEAQWFRWATFIRSSESGLVPGIYGDLERLTPGMGLWLDLGGSESFTWTRPALAEAALIEIDEGWNLVAWGGGDSLPIAGVLAVEGGAFSKVVGWDARAGEFRAYAGDGSPGVVTRGGAVWVHSRAEQRWLQPGAPAPQVVFAGEIADAVKTLVLTELQKVQEFYARRFGIIASDFAIHAYADHDTFAEMTPEQRRLSTSLCGWTEPPNRFHLILSLCEPPIAHEYFHILQGRLTLGVAFQKTSEDGAEDNPRWMNEGSAVYAAALYEQESGGSALADQRWGALVKWSALGLPLEDRRGPLETEADSFMLYSAGFLAVDWLVMQSSEEALRNYYSLLLSSVGGWTQAFETAFGLSVAEFRASFEEYRLEEAPPFEWQIAGTVLDPHGQPVVGARIDIHVWLNGKVAWATGGKTGDDGGFSFLGPGGGYTLGVSLVCPGSDRLFGPTVHGGAWGAGGFVASGNGHWDRAATGAEPFTEEEHRTGIVIGLPETERALVERHCER